MTTTMPTRSNWLLGLRGRRDRRDRWWELAGKAARGEPGAIDEALEEYLSECEEDRPS